MAKDQLPEIDQRNALRGLQKKMQKVWDLREYFSDLKKSKQAIHDADFMSKLDRTIEGLGAKFEAMEKEESRFLKSIRNGVCCEGISKGTDHC